VSLEWDEFDFASQPLTHTMYDGTIRNDLIGREYLCRIVTTGPDGHSWIGDGHVEIHIDGPYPRYGFS
jgi:hypothetical protein